jgi:hypothetical protein
LRRVSLHQDVWEGARPAVVVFLAHLLVYACALLCLVCALVLTGFAINICDSILGETESFVKAVCIIFEVLLTFILVRFH